jgi:hypothetical protein
VSKALDDDPRLKDLLRKLQQDNDYTATPEKVYFIGKKYQVLDVLTAEDVEAGKHLMVREQLLDSGQLRAVLHLGLMWGGVGNYLVANATAVYSDDAKTFRFGFLHLIWDPNEKEWTPMWNMSADRWERIWQDELPDE